jgi:hypothetical protein
MSLRKLGSETMMLLTESPKVRLCATLGLNTSDVGGLRYQLLHRTASAVYEAQRYRSRRAIMLVHSFSPMKWVTQLDKIAERKNRYFRSIAEAAERISAHNKRLTPEQALHLASHGVKRNVDGSYSWKFDEYQSSSVLMRTRNVRSSSDRYRIAASRQPTKRADVVAEVGLNGVWPGRGAFEAEARPSFCASRCGAAAVTLWKS